MQRGQAQQLLHVHIGCTWDAPHLVGNLLSNRVTALHIRADHLDINRGGQSEIQNLSDDVRRLEEEFHTRKTPWQFLPQLLHQLRRWALVLLVQTDQNFRVAGSDHSGIAVGQID